MFIKLDTCTVRLVGVRGLPEIGLNLVNIRVEYIGEVEVDVDTRRVLGTAPKNLCSTVGRFDRSVANRRSR